jgi:hypothetical protein
MRKIVPTLVLIAWVLVSSSMIAASQATDYTTIGVKVGDRVDYTVDHSGEPDWRRIEVTEVTGVFVNLTVIDYSSNTQMIHAYSQRGNVTRGDLAYVLVCAGLQAGDPLYAGAPEHFNNTLNMEIGGASRTVNEISISSDEHIYYDQQTGIFVKLEHSGGTNYTMISTTMWGPVDLTLLILTGEGAAVALAAIAIVLTIRRSKKRRV